MKRSLFYLIVFLLSWILACGDKQAKKDPAEPQGAAIYKKYCVLCHGADGKLGLNGSKDISASTFTVEERVILITNGKNTMTPFKDILTPEEIKAVAEYTMTLK